jgi:hypothetical protein
MSYPVKVMEPKTCLFTRVKTPPTTRPTGSYTEFTPYRQRPRYYGGQSGARAEQSRDGRTVAQPKHRAGPCRYGTSHHTRYATTVSHHGSHPLVARLTDIWLRLWCGLQCSAPCMPHRTLSHNPSGSQPWTSALPGSASSTLTSTDPSGPRHCIRRTNAATHVRLPSWHAV